MPKPVSATRLVFAFAPHNSQPAMNSIGYETLIILSPHISVSAGVAEPNEASEQARSAPASVLSAVANSSFVAIWQMRSP
jgi:hypothetical protein